MNHFVHETPIVPTAKNCFVFKHEEKQVMCWLANGHELTENEKEWLKNSETFKTSFTEFCMRNTEVIVSKIGDKKFMIHGNDESKFIELA
jgi:hypothetical protein